MQTIMINSRTHREQINLKKSESNSLDAEKTGG